VVANFGVDAPLHQQLIADAGHNPGAFQVVGDFAAGQQLVFYITTTFNNQTFLSTSDHAHIVPDGPDAWNIGWEDLNDFDYDDVVTRICYESPGTTGCARMAELSFGPVSVGPYVSSPYVAYQAEPVNTATGNYTTQATDLQYPGRGLPFAFSRTYNSLSTVSGNLGLGWTASTAAHLEFPAGGVSYLAGSGARSTYVPDGAGGYLRPPGQRAVLSSAGGGYDLVEPNQIRSHFDASGVLQSESDRNGNVISFAYASGRLSQVTDTVGRAILLAYLPDGHLSGVSGPQGLSVAYTYDPAGRLETVQDVRGFVTTYGYDANGRLATITDPNNHVLVTNTYGPDGRVIEQVDARGNHTTFAWDAATETSTMTDARTGQWVDDYAGGILVSQRDPLGNLTKHGFNEQLMASALTDARGYEIDSIYDGAGNLTTRVFSSPLFAVERYTYNATNDLLTAQDRNNNTTTRTYDAAGNLKTVTGPPPVSPLTTYDYDPAGTGLLFSVVDPRGKMTTFGYDAQANRTSSVTPLGFRTTTTYDAAGRMLTRVDPRGNVTGADPAQYTTTFTYDGAGNVLTVTDPLSHTTTTTYDPAGNRLTVRDANLHSTTYGYNEANGLTSVTDPRLKVTSYTYDVVGNQITRSDANTHTTTYAYDLAKRRTSETRPLSRVWTYQYDPNGNRIQTIDAIGNSTPQTGDGTTTRTYDNYNRPSGVTYSDGTPAVTFTYDGVGNRTQMTDGVTTTSTYDTLNRLTRIVRSGLSQIDYTYDPAGNVLTRTPSGGTAVTYTYDDDGRMATEVAAGLTTTYAYDAAGNATSTTLPSGNGYVELRTYDRAGRLTEVKNQKVAAVLSKSTYTLDPVGNRSTIVSTTGTTTLTYDADDRLTQACYTVACTGVDNFRRYTYDDVGNRLTEVSGSGTTTYTYDVLDQLIGSSGVGGNVTYTFNLDGNQTAAGTQTFTYDLANRLKTMTAGSTTTTYTYDGDGRRVQASTGSAANKNTKFVWDVNRPLPELLRELDGNNALQREYQYGLDLVSMKSGSSTYYFHHDGLGSVANLTSSTGVAQWTYEYHPYGVARTTTKNNNQAPTNLVQFAGQYLDPAGLYHLRARQYAPSTGRFLTVDPLGCPVGRSYVAAYSYGGDNPVSRVDPSGLESKSTGWRLPSLEEISKAIGDAWNVRIFGCKAGQLGLGLGLFLGGAALEVSSGLLEFSTAGAATPVSAAGIVSGFGDITIGGIYVREACRSESPIP
jgi:RHS repeat-associated protein